MDSQIALLLMQDGLVNGAVYGLMAVALVLVFSVTRVIFIPQGAVMWKVGLLMGLANLTGGYVGARTAMAWGAGFVRMVFVLVVGGFIVKIGLDVIAQLA